MCVSQELWLLCYTVEDIKFCEDFYLRKWGALYGKKAHGQWETVDREGGWEYGSMGWWRRSVCWKRRSVCGVCTLQYLSISMGGRFIINNNNNDNNNDHRDGDHNIDDVVGEEEVKVTKDVVVEGWWMRGDAGRTHDWLWTPVCFLPSIWMATCLMWSMVPGL